MSRLVRLVSLVLAGLPAAFLVAAPAQAGPRSPDPELAQTATRAVPRSAATVLPAAIDSDVYAYTSTPSFRLYFVVAGHLRLALKSGSSTQYAGSFVDYVGNTATRASADASNAAAPVLRLEGKNGKFTFRMDPNFGSAFYGGAATSKPSQLKVALTQIFFGATSHSIRTASYAMTLSERSGRISSPVEYTGTLTIAYDANGRISGGQVTVTGSKGTNVTHALKSSGYYSSGYFYTVAQVDKKYFGLTGTVLGTSIDGYGFAADGSRTTQWVLSGTA